MAVEVDSVIVDLEARIDQYRANMQEAIGIYRGLRTELEAPITAAGASAAAKATVQAEEQTTAAVKRTRKDRVAAVKAGAVEEAAAVQEAEKAKQAAIAKTQTLEERAAARPGNPRRVIVDNPTALGARTNEEFQASLVRPPPTPASLSGFSPAPEQAAAENVAVEREVNRLAVDRARTAAAIATATGAEKRALQDVLAELTLIDRLQKAGLSDQEVAAALTKRQTALDATRAAEAEVAKNRASTKNAEQFARGSGFYQATGGAYAIAGIAAAAAVGVSVEAVKHATEYAKALTDVSHEAGISTTALQVYQHAALEVGVSSEKFSTSLAMLSANLGKARDGSEQEGKVFAALGVNIKNGATAGDLLPTLIDRITSISDQSQRAAIEVALFGRSGKELDGLLSSGNDKVNALAEALERTGSVLSPADIAKLDETAKKLEEVKAQLSVDVAQIVAGNASAIETLAKSFSDLLIDIKGAISGIERFNATKVNQFGGPLTSGPTISSSNGFFDNVHGYIGKYEKAAQDGLRGLFRRGIGLDGPNQTAKAPPKTVTAPVQNGKVNKKLLGSLNAPKPKKPKKGPKGPSAESLEAAELTRQKRFADQNAQGQEALLKAREELSGSVQVQANAESAIASIALARKLADIDFQQKQDLNKEHLTEAQKQEVVTAAATERANAIALDQAQSQVRNQKLAFELAQEANERTQTRLSIESEVLDNAQAFARTSKDRLALALRQLDIEKQQQTASLKATIASNPADSEAAKNAKTRLNSLDQVYAGKAKSAHEENLSPGQTYARSLKVTTDTVQDSEVKALQQFNEGLDKSVSKALHLHGIFGDIVGDLIDMAIKQALIAPLANALFGGAGGAGGAGAGLSGIFSGIGKIFGGGGGGGFSASGTDPIDIFSAPLAFAAGGSGVIGGNPGVDQNLLSINGKPTARVGAGEVLSVIPKGLAADNSQAKSGTQASGPIIHQTIQYAGAVDVADKAYVQQIAVAQFQSTQQAIAQANKQTLAATPARMQRNQTLGS